MSRSEEDRGSKREANTPPENTRRRMLRDRLLDSEVYFRTLAAILLSAMAVFLAYEANRISRYQLSISEREMAIIEARELPNIHVEFTWSPSVGYCVWVKNEGGPALRIVPELCLGFLALSQMSGDNNTTVVVPLTMFGQFYRLAGEARSPLWPDVLKQALDEFAEVPYHWGLASQYRWDHRSVDDFGDYMSAQLHALVVVSYVNVLGEERNDVFYWAEGYMLRQGEAELVNTKEEIGLCFLPIISMFGSPGEILKSLMGVDQILTPRVRQRPGEGDVVFLASAEVTEPLSEEDMVAIWEKYKDQR